MSVEWGGQRRPRAEAPNLALRIIIGLVLTLAVLWLAETSTERVDDGICTEVDGDCGGARGG